MVIKYAEIFRSKIFQNVSKFGFLVKKIYHLATLWNCSSRPLIRRDPLTSNRNGVKRMFIFWKEISFSESPFREMAEVRMQCDRNCLRENISKASRFRLYIRKFFNNIVKSCTILLIFFDITLQILKCFPIGEVSPNEVKLRQFLTSPLAPRGEIRPLGVNFPSSFPPRGEHSLLFWRIEGQTENFTPRG
jgi:hypothetical protein